MKSDLFLFSVLTCLSAAAQVATQPDSVAPRIVERGPHHQLWEGVSTDADGLSSTNSYTELATGLNYLDPRAGQWEETKEQFVIGPQGYATATKGQHQVILAPDINTGGSVDLLTPDNVRLLNNPMGLNFYWNSRYTPYFQAVGDPLVRR